MPTDMTVFPRIMILALALALTLGAAIPAAAQQPGPSDLQALRFYLEQDNDVAVRSELRRLQIQFPDWTPPANLSDMRADTGPDSIDRIYRLIESGDFDGARALIAETDRDFADWSPPTEMLSLLNLSEAQQQFTAAVAAQQAETAIGIARGIPALLSCERINNAWELAEMHLLLGETSRALGIYRSVIGSCSASEILISTLEKADAVANLTELESLADAALASAPDAATDIRRVENRLRAGRQVPARWPNGEQVIELDAATTAPPDTTAPTAATPPASTRPPPRPEAPSTPSAPQPQATAPAQSGAGLSSVAAAAQRGAWAECLALSANSSRIDVIYQRGWCAYNAERPMEAVTAFQRAARQGGSATVRRDAAFGWMLSLLKLNMTEQAAQIAASVDLTRDQRIEIESQILDQRGLRAYESGDYARAIAYIDAHAQLTGSMRRDLGLLKGYSLLNMGNRNAARDIFLQLHRQLATSETRRALRAAE
ncbi:hypothetical protein [Roseinatronobacter alkalisoli]|uniref:Tetratricopeptide repeat protein n=1 Tax=Roseinatronobacter alkalisoli TaxID=3028235 RepID=A0ABT5TE17_9RHOB|nr:hypothetical protein [Roseinatronobacter sp. HJB301]MDD7973362.1 hypothetical protein [Roseinatronobacter sp. HJB301]